MVVTRRSARLNPPKEPTPEEVEFVEDEPTSVARSPPSSSSMMIIDEDSSSSSDNDDEDVEIIEDSPDEIQQVESEENDAEEDNEEVQQNGLPDEEESDEEGEETNEEAEAIDDEEKVESEHSEEDEEELEEEPPQILSLHQWTQLFEESNFEDLKQAIIWTSKVQRNWRKAFEEHLGNGVEAFIGKLGEKEKISPQEMRGLFFDGHLGAAHFVLILLKRMGEQISEITRSPTAKWNVFRCLKAIESALGSAKEFKVHKVAQYHGEKKGMKAIKRVYQDLWLDLIKKKLSKKLLRAVVVYLSKSVISLVPTPHLFAEFFFKIFKRGNVFAILALDGIFELIVKHNFEFPDFYEYVYQQTTAAVFYTDHKWHFLQNVDKFLSSSHVPDYVVAGFLKRFSRLLLWAPLDAQESLLALIKNLLIRHRNLNILIHRDVAEKLSDDPYLEDKSLKDCQAFDSSLWEIKAMQSHWFANVAKRANFIDRPTEKIESVVRIRSFGDYLQQLFDRKYGEALASKSAYFEESQDFQDDEEENEAMEQEEMRKDSRKRSKINKKSGKKSKTDYEISLRTEEPNGKFFQPLSTVCDFNQFWTG